MPAPVAQQIAIIYAVTNGLLDDVKVENVRSWEAQFHDFMKNAHAETLDVITKEKRLSDETIDGPEEGNSRIQGHR